MLRHLGITLFLCLLFLGYVSANTIYFVPYPGSNPLKSFYDPYSSQDEYAKKWVCLREELEGLGYRVKFTWDAENIEDFSALISITNINAKLLKNLKQLPSEKCWLLVFEPPVYLPKIYAPSLQDLFSKIFVMFDDLVDDQNYFKFYYPQPRLQMNEDIPGFYEKKLCVLMAGNKHSAHPQELYSERKKMISFFEQFHKEEFDLYGHGWEGYSSWKGSVKCKWDIIKQYRFCLCYENMKDQFGYITEKIFDCFVGGCVPIYWGASNIYDYIPQECFIDRRNFATDEDLYLFISNMDEASYQAYLTAIAKFLSSPKAKLFSIDQFIATIKAHLKPECE